MKPQYKMMDCLCSECGNESYVKIEDYGIGKTEYWGAVAWDTQLEAVSACCEATPLDIKTLKPITELEMRL